MTKYITVNEMPNLTFIYRHKKIKVSEDAKIKNTPSQKLNDKIRFVRGDITKLEVDAIVNAANEHLQGGGGIDFAIHKGAGPGLRKEESKLGGCETGNAKITGGHNLPAKHIIHAVGPDMRALQGDYDKGDTYLEGCYRRSLEVAVENQLKNIVFNCISTGIYAFDNDRASVIALQSTRDFLESADGDKIDDVVFCLFTETDVKAYDKRVV
jgi:O-acetyl-ADP-ribose deacetylase (regulator of RNase III)